MSKILVVEENPNLRLLYKQELEREGDRVITATNTVQAIQEFEDESPDLVVLDAGRAPSGGLRVVERMLALDRKIPIVLNTACRTYADEPLGWAVDAYLVKSSDTSELRSKVRELLHPQPSGKGDSPKAASEKVDSPPCRKSKPNGSPGIECRSSNTSSGIDVTTTS